MTDIRKPLTMKRAFLIPIVCLVFCGCGKKPGPADADAAAGAAKIYNLTDVDQELKEGKVDIGGTREDAQAFFQAHPEYQVCQDSESFLVAVMRNKKKDPKADDIFIVTNYRDGKISAMEVGPPQFSVNNLPSYCK